MHLVTLLACGEPVTYRPPEDTDTDTPVDTDPTGDTAEDTGPPPDTSPVSGSLTFLAFGDQEPVEGVRVTAGDELYETDATGLTSLEVPGNSTTEIATFIDLYLRSQVWLVTDGEDGWSRPVTLPRRELYEVLVAAFAGSYDASQASVFVSVATPDGAGGWTGVEGASVALDVAGTAFHDAGGGDFAPGGELDAGRDRGSTSPTCRRVT